MGERSPSRLARANWVGSHCDIAHDSHHHSVLATSAQTSFRATALAMAALPERGVRDACERRLSTLDCADDDLLRDAGCALDCLAQSTRTMVGQRRRHPGTA